MCESDLHANRIADNVGSPTVNPGQSSSNKLLRLWTNYLPNSAVDIRHYAQKSDHFAEPERRHKLWLVGQRYSFVGSLWCRFSNVMVKRTPLTSEDPNSVKTGKTDFKRPNKNWGFKRTIECMLIRRLVKKIVIGVSRMNDICGRTPNNALHLDPSREMSKIVKTLGCRIGAPPKSCGDESS